MCACVALCSVQVIVFIGDCVRVRDATCVIVIGGDCEGDCSVFVLCVRTHTNKHILFRSPSQEAIKICFLYLNKQKKKLVKTCGWF